jgi:two-component system response regulator QseB
MRLLLVEDDTMLGEAVCDGLRQDGYVVDWVTAGDSARAVLATTPFSALVLDLGLPKGDGTTMLHWLRKRRHPIPVVITTARDRVTDRIAALDAGADDYLVKPFDLDELAARLRAVMRRAAGRADSTIRVGELTLDLGRRSVTRLGQAVTLTAREYALLALLMQSGVALTRVEIEAQLYGFDDEVGSNAIEVHIHRLRRKLGAHVIKNVKGRGYHVGPDQ